MNPSIASLWGTLVRNINFLMSMEMETRPSKPPGGLSSLLVSTPAAAALRGAAQTPATPASPSVNGQIRLPRQGGLSDHSESQAESPRQFSVLSDGNTEGCVGGKLWCSKRKVLMVIMRHHREKKEWEYVPGLQKFQVSLDVQFLVSRSKEWIDLSSEDLGILNSQYYLKLYIKGYSLQSKRKVGSGFKIVFCGESTKVTVQASINLHLME